MKPAYWALYTGLGLYALVAVSHVGMKWMRNDLHNGIPRAHFYSQAAYDNCGAMFVEAKKQGAPYWTCHRPRS